MNFIPDLRNFIATCIAIYNFNCPNVVSLRNIDEVKSFCLLTTDSKVMKIVTKCSNQVSLMK
eukprot:UN15129